MHTHTEQELDEAWDCPTCCRPTPPSQDVECHCGMLVSHHVPATELCRRLRAAQQRENKLIVENSLLIVGNQRLKDQLEEVEKCIQKMKFDSSYRITTWPYDTDPFTSPDHDNDSRNYQ